MPSERGYRRWLRHLCGTLVLLTAAAAASAAGTGLRASIADTLVVPATQRFAPFHWKSEPEIVALYFGAGWCGPCHAFVPELKRVHASLTQAGADTDVVYISLDDSEADMRRYMYQHQMPWPAVDYHRLRMLAHVRELAGVAPPNLVLLDRDGNIIATRWKGRRNIGLKPVLDAWVAAVSRPGSAPPHPTSGPVRGQASP